MKVDVILELGSDADPGAVFTVDKVSFSRSPCVSLFSLSE